MKKVEFHKIYLTNLITNTLKVLLKTRSKIRFPRGHVGSAPVSPTSPVIRVVLLNTEAED